MTVTRYLMPNEDTTTPESIWIWGIWFLIGWVIWEITRSPVLPNPVDVVLAFGKLGDLFPEVVSSFSTNLEALILSVLVSLPLAYVCRVPALRPLGVGLSKLRFLTPTVFISVFILSLPNGAVKVGVLTLGESFFLTTTMIGVVDNISQLRFDHARTLKIGPWRSIWWVVVRGTLPQAFDAIRDNAAMGWAMTMMVEGAFRQGGGVGVVLSNSDKHLDFDILWAVSLVIVVVGLSQDWLIGKIKATTCSWRPVG